MPPKSIGRLALCLLLCLGVGFLEGLVTRPQIAGWYAGLSKPSWTPPPILFPIVWTALYVMMAIALWRLWDRVGSSPARTAAIRLFVLQLAINAAWSPVFFGWHGIRTGLLIIVALLAALAVTIVATGKVDRVAAWLLTPYLIWVAYATTINAGVVAFN